MLVLWIPLLLAPSLLLLPQVDASGCSQLQSLRACNCSDDVGAITVTCENVGMSDLHDVLISLSRWRGIVERMVLRNNRFSSLSHRLFAGISVYRLEILDNGLDIIDRGLFHGLEDTLTHLVLKEPTARKFAFDVFDDLRSLETLTIDRTPVQVMPSLMRTERLRMLRINGTQIRDIPARSLRSVPELRILHFTHNPLTSIGEGSLLGLQLLRVANFSFNRLQYVHPRAFFPTSRLDHLLVTGNQINDASMITIAAREAKNLRRIDLSKNLVEQIKVGTFVDMRNLEILSVRENFIAKVHKDSFDALPRLKRLDLSNNYISSLQPGVFNRMNSLEQLLIQRNNISQLEGISEVLGKLPSMRVLDLSLNIIEQIPANVLSHSTLEILHLNHNNLKKVDHTSFMDMPNLRELHLHHNFLQSDSHEYWWNLPQLALLDLSYNDIDRLHAGVFRNISSLIHADFSYNIIKVMDENTFEGVPSLQHLNLSFNLLPHVYTFTFQKLSDLVTIDMSYNELVSVDTGLFSKSDHLREIHLKFNKLSNVMPNSLPEGESLKTLDLSYNFLGFFPADALRSTAGLVELRLKQNSLKEIPIYALQKLTKIEKLDLGFNMFKTLNPSVLKSMPELLSVDFSGNFLKTIPLQIFANNKNLHSVNISNNLLSDIPPKTFHDLLKLEVLDLKNNTLTMFDEMVNQLTSLRLLDASYNNIQQLSSTTFENTPSLERLIMHHNYIERVKSNTFLNMPSLQRLDLGFNAMEDMDPGSFRGNPRLHTILLNNNLLTSLKASTFVNLLSLRTLDMQENQLANLDRAAYENVPGLRAFNLSSNALSSLERDTFQRLEGLRVLDLSANQLHEVSGGTFRPLTKLQKLLLQDNGMCRIHEDAFSGQRSLKTVRLDNNRLRFLRASLIRRIKGTVHDLDISGNPLSCDCEMQWLRDWLGELRARNPPIARSFSEPICYYPEDMRGVPMLRTRETEFHCDSVSLRNDPPCPEFSDQELKVFQPPAAVSGSRRPHQLENSQYDETDESVNEISSNELAGKPGTPVDRVDHGEAQHQLSVSLPSATTEKTHSQALSEATAQIPAPTATTPLTSDYIAGDTPTIYVGSAKRPNSTQKQTGTGLTAGLMSAGGILGTLGTLGTLLPKLGLTFGLGGTKTTNRKGLLGTFVNQGNRNKPMRDPALYAGTDFGPQASGPNTLQAANFYDTQYARPPPSQHMLPPTPSQPTSHGGVFHGQSPGAEQHQPIRFPQDTPRPQQNIVPPQTAEGERFVPAKHGHIRTSDTGDQLLDGQKLNAYVFRDPGLSTLSQDELNSFIYSDPTLFNGQPPSEETPQTITMDAPFQPSVPFDHNSPPANSGPSSAPRQPPSQQPNRPEDFNSYGEVFGLSDVITDYPTAQSGAHSTTFNSQQHFSDDVQYDQTTDHTQYTQTQANTIPHNREPQNSAPSFSEGLQAVGDDGISLDDLLDEIKELEDSAAEVGVSTEAFWGAPSSGGSHEGELPQTTVEKELGLGGVSEDEEAYNNFSLEDLLNMITEETTQITEQTGGSDQEAGGSVLAATTVQREFVPAEVTTIPAPTTYHPGPVSTQRRLGYPSPAEDNGQLDDFYDLYEQQPSQTDRTIVAQTAATEAKLPAEPADNFGVADLLDGILFGHGKDEGRTEPPTTTTTTTKTEHKIPPGLETAPPDFTGWGFPKHTFHETHLKAALGVDTIRYPVTSSSTTTTTTSTTTATTTTEASTTEASTTEASTTAAPTTTSTSPSTTRRASPTRATSVRTVVGRPAAVDTPRGRPSITKVQPYFDYDEFPQFLAPSAVAGIPGADPTRPSPGDDRLALDQEPASAPERESVPFGNRLSRPGPAPVAATSSPRVTSPRGSSRDDDWYYRNYFSDQLGSVPDEDPLPRWPTTPPQTAAADTGVSSALLVGALTLLMPLLR